MAKGQPKCPIFSWILPTTTFLCSFKTCHSGMKNKPHKQAFINPVEGWLCSCLWFVKWLAVSFSYPRTFSWFIGNECFCGLLESETRICRTVPAGRINVVKTWNFLSISLEGKSELQHVLCYISGFMVKQEQKKSCSPKQLNKGDSNLTYLLLEL